MLGKFRSAFTPFLKRLVKYIPSSVPPSALTLLTIPFSILYLYYIIEGKFVIAIAMLIASAILDALDGALARFRGIASPQGALLDSTVDRINDVIYSVSLYFLGVPWIVVFLWGTGSILVSLTRAAAEAEGSKLEGYGIMERGDRIVALLILILIHIAEYKFTPVSFKYTSAFAAGLTALIWLTVFQRSLLSGSRLAAWVGLNLSIITFVVLTKGMANLLGFLGYTGALTHIYVALRGRSLGLNYPADMPDIALDSLMLLSFIYLAGTPSWIFAITRFIRYFNMLKKSTSQQARQT